MTLAEFISQIYWRPQIGDPTFMGWLTVAAYALTAGLCFIVAKRPPAAAAGGAAAEGHEARVERRMWLGVAALMAFLCVNKQFDLQSLFTAIGRVIAHQTGWYEQRRIVQRWFVLAVGVVGASVLALVVWKLRAALKGRALLIIGLISLLTFIIIRAASFHHVDEFLGWRFLGFRMNWILELGGIALVALSAAQAVHRARRPTASGGPS